MGIRIGQTAPGLDLALQAYDRTKDNTDKQFQDMKLADLKGKWVCLYFYPLDFTFVCPTEIIEYVCNKRRCIQLSLFRQSQKYNLICTRF